MPLNSEGCTDNTDLRNWYLFLLENQEAQESLIECSCREEFIEKLMFLSRKNGYNFSLEALKETFSPWRGLEIPDESDRWIRKIMEMGWAPLGYTR